MEYLLLLTYLVIFFGAINLLRMAIFLIGSDLYLLAKERKKKLLENSFYLPKFSVIIPAFNEEATIARCLKSLENCIYLKEKLEIIVVDDGSTDNTSNIVRELKQKPEFRNVILVNQPNLGKANALNNGIKNYATGELVMCLDADSCLDEYALFNAAPYFIDERVKALASNVKIIPRKGLLNLVQRLEYMICYQMKRAQTAFNIEYIIGGIGSTFRKSALQEVDFYDGDTVTEDIDLTMKILRGGNKQNRVIYGSDVIAHTEAVLDIKGLIKQRYRWKWGRCQTFLKNKSMFFNNDPKFTKFLTCFNLPFAIFGDLAYFIEPLLLLFILAVSIAFKEPLIIISALIVISGYMFSNIIREETLSTKEKLLYTFLTPFMYFYFYILSFVEYTALIKAVLNLGNLKSSVSQKVCTWQHVERPVANLN